MPDNIPKQRHGSRDPIQRAGWVTTWLVKDVSSGDDDEVAAVKAASAGNTHFVTFITASTDNRESDLGTTAGGAVHIQLKDDSTVVWEAWVSDINGNNPAHFAFPAPIQLTEGNAISVVSVMAGATDRVSVTFGGFTDNGRVD